MGGPGRRMQQDQVLLMQRAGASCQRLPVTQELNEGYYDDGDGDGYYNDVLMVSDNVSPF